MEHIQAQITIIAKAIAKALSLSDKNKKVIAAEQKLSVNTINNCVNGKNVNMKSILAIADSLGMNIKELIEFAEKEIEAIPASDDTPRAVDTEAVREAVDGGVSPEQLAMRMGEEDTERVEEAAADAFSCIQ